jgi:hypothetical protein
VEELLSIFIYLVWSSGYYCGRSSSSFSASAGSMVEAVVAAVDRLASGAHQGSFSLAVCDSVPRPDLMGVGHLLPWLQSSVQASSPVALPQVARSPVVVRWHGGCCVATSSGSGWRACGLDRVFLSPLRSFLHFSRVVL